MIIGFILWQSDSQWSHDSKSDDDDDDSSVNEGHLYSPSSAMMWNELWMNYMSAYPHFHFSCASSVKSNISNEITPSNFSIYLDEKLLNHICEEIDKFDTKKAVTN